ncbi:hypothetical protein BT63DRAFT_484498 [Microthyrium microscopicum]|uniref:Uncharacterized protein n=1 Tax=Microthyrium microscopicum TaxID=703497 RepID=A0A6A6TVH3_9PEZI|nr:hypothetical protein BT63DRAFT_484498 [Microthyrium microscopicum]
MSAFRVAARRLPLTTRSFSTIPAMRNSAAESASFPVSEAREAVRTVAERAHSAVAQQASVEGFRAGVVYTLLAGSVATAGIVMLSPDGEREVKGEHLL